MNSIIGKFRRKRDSNASNTPSNNNYQHHRDSITSDHIYFAQTSSQPPISQVVDLGSGTDDDSVSGNRKKSQLATSLQRLLSDASALSYFIQFLESSDKLNLIKFWMHVEGFKASFSEGIPAAQELSLLDAKSIYEKYIDDDSTSSLVLPKKIKKLVDDSMSTRPLTANCFDDAQEFVKQLFELRYFEEFRTSVYYKKHELSVLSQGCSVSDVLKVQPLLQTFIEFMSSKDDHDMVQFLLGCESFEMNLDNMDDSDALDDAMALYDKYFSMQATNQIEIGAPMRSQIESMICHESGRPRADAFRTASAVCRMRLHEKLMAEFTRSPLFLGYLAELSAQIENTVELPRANRVRRVGSSSDAPSSSDSLTSVFNRHIDNLDRTIDDVDRTPVGSPRSRHSTPRTPRSSRLAEIDEMGRYHALYDDSHAHSHSSKAPSRIKSTLRKYLDKSSLKEEEIAEEVARTIIADMQRMVSSAAPI